MIPVLYTERLVLRAPGMDDFAAFAAFHASPRSKGTGGPLDAREAFRSFAALAGHWHLKGFGWWMIARDDQAIGYTGLHEPPYKVGPELGWVIFEGAEGRGYAREAASAALNYARHCLRPARLLSYIADGNLPSERLAHALGARPDTSAGTQNPGMTVWAHDLGGIA
ncbi:MAG: GNAT family N-acetyltransferase [Pseudomonadota bacterium]